MSNRVNWYFGQAVAESELDLAFQQLEDADRALCVDEATTGIFAGLDVNQVTPVAAINVSIVSGAAYDQLGRRCGVPSAKTLAVSNEGTTEIGSTIILAPGNTTAVAGAGNEKWVSVFVKFDRLIYETRTDGNGNPVKFRSDESFRFMVTQGIEAPAGTAIAPPLQADAILLGDVKRYFGQTQILSPDVSTARRESQYNLVGTPRSLQKNRTRDAVQALLDMHNQHVLGLADHHPADVVDVATSGPWADGVTNPAGALQVRIDKIISDLAAPAGAVKVGSAAITGTPKSLLVGSLGSQMSALLTHLNDHLAAANAHTSSQVAYPGNTQGWFDGIAHPGTSVQGQFDKMLGDLRANGGAAKIGAAAIAGSPGSVFSFVAGSIQDLFVQVLNDLNVLGAGGGGGGGGGAATGVSVAARAAWANPSVTNPATNAQDAFNKVVTDLASTVTATPGSKNIGTAATGNFPVGGALLSGTVQSMFNDLATYLSDTATGTVSTGVPTTTFSGAQRIGAKAQNVGSSAVATGTIFSQVTDLLTLINALVGGGVNAIQLQGRDINAVAPTDGDLLAWHNASGKWRPQAPGTGAGVAQVSSALGSIGVTTGTGPNAVIDLALGHANAWTATQSFDTAGDTTPGIAQNVAPAGSRKLMWQGPNVSGVGRTRFYSAGITLGFEIAVNANWDGGATWNPDVAGSAALFSFNKNGRIAISTHLSAGAWGDGGWQDTFVIHGSAFNGSNAQIESSGIAGGQSTGAFGSVSAYAPSAGFQVGSCINYKIEFPFIPSGGFFFGSPKGPDINTSFVGIARFSRYGCTFFASAAAIGGVAADRDLLVL